MMDEKGSTINYYLQNNTSKDLYYQLKSVASEIKDDGVVEVAQLMKISRAKGFEVSGHPFVKIKVYDNKQRDILLFECLSEPMQSEYWSIEKVQIDLQIYNQILVLTDEMLSMED